MKRVIAANRREITNTVSSNDHDELREKLFDDLSLNFEDNIVMRYAKYIDGDVDPNYVVSRNLTNVLNAARDKYLEAVAKIIENADSLE